MVRKGIKVSDITILLLLLLFSLFCLVPLLLSLAVSLTDEACIQKYGYNLIPAKLSIKAYKTIFLEGSIMAKLQGF